MTTRTRLYGSHAPAWEPHGRRFRVKVSSAGALQSCVPTPERRNDVITYIISYDLR